MMRTFKVTTRWPRKKFCADLVEKNTITAKNYIHNRTMLLFYNAIGELTDSFPARWTSVVELRK
tara:strand:- start:1189 stop:1380 length:192 start_codon:yes stop_codon:yes gene_type:complete